ncbi:MAG TPA: DUF5668 domain-containing protein [Candidatus Limnocylindria bacterium]|nr:DUF5668 domain-containing protein [Candidatus Limnocylindria bacterium]
MTAPTMAMPAPQRTPSIAFPLVLISLGVAFLLVNMGYLARISWAELARLWPVLIILAGVDLLLRPRSFAAAAIAEIAIVVATFAYLFTATTLAPASLAYTVNVPRAAATELSLTVNYGAGTLTLAGGGTDLVAVRSSEQDVKQTVDQTGSFAGVTLSSREDGTFWGRDRNWDVRLPSDVQTGMTLNLGAGDFDVDLTNVRTSRATINAGASDLTVTLPKPSGNVPMTISGGASSLTLIVPAGVEYAVTTKGVMHSVQGVTQSAGYATAADRVTIEVSIAAGSVTIR